MKVVISPYKLKRSHVIYLIRFSIRLPLSKIQFVADGFTFIGKISGTKTGFENRFCNPWKPMFWDGFLKTGFLNPYFENGLNTCFQKTRILWKGLKTGFYKPMFCRRVKNRFLDTHVFVTRFPIRVLKLLSKNVNQQI